MRNGLIQTLTVFSVWCALSAPMANAAKVGEPAPAFSGTDSNGKKVDLKDKAYQGKYVVLEWHNKECPYVKEQYESGKMQAAQEEWTGKGVIWLSVVSSAPKAEGAVTPAQANADLKSSHAKATAMVLDPLGVIGHAYDAKTTPHMFVIDPKGTLIYNGAIDSEKSGDKGPDGKPINYVSLALTESMASKPLTHPNTKPYGCSVKYQ